MKDDDVVTLWGLVIEGFAATQSGLLKEIEDELGLAPAHFDILLRLLRTPEHGMSMTRLARDAALTSGGLTKLADKMEEFRLIVRMPSERDRRVTAILLTDDGMALARKARRITAEYLRRNVLSPLGVEAAETLGESMRALRSANAKPSPDGKADEPAASQALA